MADANASHPSDATRSGLASSTLASPKIELEKAP